MDLGREWHLGLLVGTDYDKAMEELLAGGPLPVYTNAGGDR
jgi:hypothetical protein